MESTTTVLEGGVSSSAATRRRRLEQLCNAHGGLRQVASRAEVSWQYLDQIIKGVLLPPKADGTRSPRTLGDDQARKIEVAFDLGEGWFDWPFDAIDFKEWAALTEAQQLYVQGAMRNAMHAAKQLISAHQSKDSLQDFTRQAQQQQSQTPELLRSSLNAVPSGNKKNHTLERLARQAGNERTDPDQQASR